MDPVTTEELQFASDILLKIIGSYKQNIVGQESLLRSLLISLITEGHVLLEGAPGLAKTRAVNTIAQATHLHFKRVQFTPDLLPSDLIGNLVFNPKEGKYSMKKGPVFTNILLADEINRAPAKVQSALLEAMQEKQVTIGEKTYKLPKPFIVLATQNPIEQEGTFALPEAQVDRFLLKGIVGYPTLEEEVVILNLVEVSETVENPAVSSLEEIMTLRGIVNRITFAPKLKEYVAHIMNASRTPNLYGLDDLTGTIAFGASPRASIAFMQAGKAVALLAGRDHVIPEDIKDLRYDILRHRILLTFEAVASEITVTQVIDRLFDTVKVP